MSCQFRPQPQKNGIAATSASIGAKTNTPVMICCALVVGFSSISGTTLRSSGAALGSRDSAVSSVGARTVPLASRVSGVLAMFSPEVGRPQAATLYAYVTVAYDTVGCARALDEFLDMHR